MDHTDLLGCYGIIIEPGSPPISKDGRGASNGLFKQGLKCSRAVTAVSKPVEEQFNLDNEVRLVGDKGIILV